MIEKGFKNAVIFYISSAMLGFVLMPNKINALGYIFILGLYTIVKSIIEKIGNFKIELLIKIVYFLLIAGVTSVISEKFIFTGSFWPVFFSMIILMAVYDYGATVLLSQYRIRFKNIKHK